MCCEKGCTSCITPDGKPCSACPPDCPCVGDIVDTPEAVIAGLFLILHDRFSREYLPETDGPPSTREVFDRLTRWSENVFWNKA